MKNIIGWIFGIVGSLLILINLGIMLITLIPAVLGSKLIYRILLGCVFLFVGGCLLPDSEIKEYDD